MGGSFDEKMFSLTNEARTTAAALIDQKKLSDSLSGKVLDIDKRVLVVETEQKNFTEHFATKNSLEQQKNYLIVACISTGLLIAGLAIRVFL